MVMFVDFCDIILVLVILEKFYGLLDDNVYMFLVCLDFNKMQIKIVVEKIFVVKVVLVNIVNWQGKCKCIWIGYGKCKSIKCVIVILVLGSRLIDLFGVLVQFGDDVE